MVPIGIDLANQLRHGYVPLASDLLKALPELLLNADAGLVPCNDNRTFENQRLHCFSPANEPPPVFLIGCGIVKISSNPKRIPSQNRMGELLNSQRIILHLWP